MAFLLILLFTVISLGSYLLNLSFISERRSLAIKEEKLEEERLRIHMEKENLAVELENLQKEKKKLREKVAHIEKNMGLIEEHLSKRRAIEKPLGVGGAYHKVNLEDLPHLDFLKERSDYLLSTVRSIPVDYPVYGRITLRTSFGDLG